MSRTPDISVERDGAVDRSVDLSMESARPDRNSLYVWNSYARTMRNCSWLFVLLLLAVLTSLAQ